MDYALQMAAKVKLLDTEHFAWNLSNSSMLEMFCMSF